MRLAFSPRILLSGNPVLNEWEIIDTTANLTPTLADMSGTLNFKAAVVSGGISQQYSTVREVNFSSADSRDITVRFKPIENLANPMNNGMNSIVLLECYDSSNVKLGEVGFVLAYDSAIRYRIPYSGFIGRVGVGAYTVVSAGVNAQADATTLNQDLTYAMQVSLSTRDYSIYCSDGTNINATALGAILVPIGTVKTKWSLLASVATDITVDINTRVLSVT